MSQVLVSSDWLNINSYAIWDSVKAKNPQEDKCLTFEVFKERFEEIAYKNFNDVSALYKGNNRNKTKINELKIKAPIWRPNAIYGNRPNGTKAERVIMGSGFYAFDVDFDNVYNFKGHQERLDGYKKTLMRDCNNIFAVYKSFSMTGLHIITKGISVKDNKSYRQMWDYERRKLKRDFRFLKVDEKAKDITRALFIGSDDEPLIDINVTQLDHLFDEENLIKRYVEEKVIELPSNVDLEFAKVQCMINPSFIEGKKDRFIRFFTNYEDLDETLKKKFKTIFHDVVNLKTGEDYPIDAYLLDTLAPIYLPKFYIGQDGFIPVGRRRSTLVSLLSKFLYLNGYWLSDAIPLVKTHFDKHYFEKFEQRKGNQFTKEEMFSVIDSCLKDKLLPHTIDARTSVDNKFNPKQNFNRKNIFIDHHKSELSPNQSGIITKKFNKMLKIKRVMKFCFTLYALYGKGLSIKELYYKGENVWGYLRITSLSSLRQFLYRNKIDVSYLHIIKTLSYTKYIYEDMLNTDKALPVLPKAKGKGN